MTKSQTKRCECGLWHYREGQNEVSTGCEHQVGSSRRFAQGHDAVLKSLLIRAGIAGADVTRADGRTFGPTSAAERYGFGHQVSAGIAKGRAKADAVAARQHKATEATPEVVKIGRWWYPVISNSNGRIGYRDKAGQARFAPQGAQVSPRSESATP